MEFEDIIKQNCTYDCKAQQFKILVDGLKPPLSKQNLERIEAIIASKDAIIEQTAEENYHRGLSYGISLIVSAVHDQNQFEKNK